MDSFQHDLMSGRYGQQELADLGFESQTALASYLREQAQRPFEQAMTGFVCLREQSGYQTTVQIGEHFAIKTPAQICGMPVEETRASFDLSAQRLGGLVTPFLIQYDGERVSFAVARVATPVDRSSILERGQGLSMNCSILSKRTGDKACSITTYSFGTSVRWLMCLSASISA